MIMVRKLDQHEPPKDDKDEAQPEDIDEHEDVETDEHNDAADDEGGKSKQWLVTRESCFGWVKKLGIGTAVGGDGPEAEAACSPHTIQGCFRISASLIRYLGVSVKHFWIKSWTSGDTLLFL